MRVAFFTHNFLEPTHHAIAQILRSMTACRYSVFAKRFEHDFGLSNVQDRIEYRRGPIPQLRRTNFDLVHTIYDGVTAIRAHQAATEAGLPFVLSFHGGFDTQVKIHDPLFREQSRIITQTAAVVTVPSWLDIDRLRGIGVERPVQVLPVPVVLSASRETRCAVSGKLALVGRLVPKKGVDLAIQAMVQLPDHSLDIVGDGELRGMLESLAEESGVANRVHFRGLLPLDEMEQILLQASALLHPARIGEDGNAEGTPQIVLMAQELGVPVVATHSGHLEEILEDGVTGLLVPPEDPQALANAVHRLAGDTALRERLESLPSQGERNIEAVSHTLAAVYQQALQQGAALVD